MLFFADWLAQGRVWPAMQEMARRAAIGRVSFWALAYRNAILPLLPRTAHAWLVHDQHEAPPPPWLERATMRRYGFATRPSSAHAYGGRLGQHYRHAVVSSIGRLESPSHGGIIADAMDVRHPLLYRPLVEFALRLPPELRARPHAHRWVLREAMRGILPDNIRRRVGKPGTADVLGWSFLSHHAHLEPLTHDPILAELGIVNAPRLRAAFDAALQNAGRGGQAYALLFATLGVEAWLQIRSGRWPCEGH
jgi:asparagine synthase (glutamine-hydrolysing)